MNQRFFSKFMNLFLVLMGVKLLLILISIPRVEMKDFWVSFFLLLVFLVILGLVITALGRPSAGRSTAGGGVLLEESLFDRLRRKYEALANEYKEQGEFKKASNIYLKLLQNPYQAATVLEEGKLYNEAAVLYLAKLSNKAKAAECYENGKNYKKAIEIQKELNNREKIGDLYMMINDQKAAYSWYESLVADYTHSSQYVKAALVCRNKMKNSTGAQDLLLTGWRQNADAFNCINNYFACIKEPEKLKETISMVYKDVPEAQKETFLAALKYEFDKGEAMEEFSRDMAYEIVSERILKKPMLASELKHFNPKDKLIVKDIIRYKAARNKIIG